MKKVQINHYRMFLSLQEFMNLNSATWSTIPRIVTYNNDFEQIMLMIAEKSGQSKEGVSIIDKKDKLKMRIAQKLSVMAGVITAYAHENENLDLANKVNLSKSNISKMRETDIDAYVKLTTDIAKKNIQELLEYGMSEALITELLDINNEYNGLIGKPQSQRNKKFVSIGELDQLFDEANNLLRNKLDKLMLMFRDSNPVFYEGYQRARTIVDR